MVGTRSILPVMLDKATVRKRGAVILDGISLQLNPDGFTIVMGPNGCGKTTLLRLLHGLERARSGTVQWSGSEDDARMRQAFVFQTPIMMRRTVLDTIAYPLIVRGTAKHAAREMAGHRAGDVGLSTKLHLETQALSGGERQKLAIARALLCEPDVLFLDEPTTNLDGTSTREIETILQTVHDGGTRVIMATHDIGQAKRLASEIVFLNKGRLVEQTPAAVFFAKPQSEAARSYLAGDIIE
ncbi:MAG: ATP-binding cassette domain-containing protein [Pseudomonadota bacterium]